MHEMTSFEMRAERWIPHRGAMRLLDRVVAVDDTQVVAEVEVPFDGLFVRDGGVPAWVGIEYMAQAVSAWAGARARSHGGAPRAGLLLGTRKYETSGEPFACGARLRIEARCEIMGGNGLGLFDCTIEDEAGVKLAGARISVFDPPEGSSVLDGGQA